MRSLDGLQKPQKLRITTAGLPRAGFQPTEVLASGIEIPGGKALSRPLQDVPTGGRAHIFGAAIAHDQGIRGKLQRILEAPLLEGLPGLGQSDESVKHAGTVPEPTGGRSCDLAQVPLTIAKSCRVRHPRAGPGRGAGRLRR
jgi:hypothetical protein